MTSARVGREGGQALVLMLALCFMVLLGAGVLAALGRALLGQGRIQRSADLAAVSAARSMRVDFPRLFEPPVVGGRANPRHLSQAAYLARARLAAARAADSNGAGLAPGGVSFPDRESFAPVRVRVRVRGRLGVHTGIGGGRDRQLAAGSSAEAEVVGSQGAASLPGDGGGYAGPFALRQGKPMRPDVAHAFDRMEEAAAADGLALLIVSAYRSDAEQARLFARHPDPRWVAPPGKSLHRLGTELDLGPASAYGWLGRNSGRFHFLRRYSWEPWHYELPLAPYRK